MTEKEPDEMSDSKKFDLQEMYDQLNTARNDLRDAFLKIKPFPSGRVGFYFEPARYRKDGLLKDSGFIVPVGEGKTVAYSFVTDYISDEVFSVSQFLAAKRVFEDFINTLSRNVFIHPDKTQALSTLPRWLTVLFYADGELVPSVSKFGYSFKNQPHFGNSPDSRSGTLTNFHSWVQWLDDNDKIRL